MNRWALVSGKDGFYSLKNFGIRHCGPEGIATATFVIESASQALYFEFQASAHDLATRMDTTSSLYNKNEVQMNDLVRVYEENGACVIEAQSGTLYDCFKEQASKGACLLKCAKPVVFYWRGVSEAA